MSLIKLSFKDFKVKKIEYGDQEIEIRPFMTISEQILLIRHYVMNFLYPNNERIIIDGSFHDTVWSEMVLMREVLELYTNIDLFTKNDQGELVFDNDAFEAFFISNLWEDIKKNIVNYADFEKRLFRALEDTKEQIYLQKSVGASLDLIVFKVSSFLDVLSDFLNKIKDVSPEDIEKMKTTGKELLGDLEKSPIAQVFKEAQMNTSKMDVPVELMQNEPAQKTTKTRGRKKKSDLVQ